MSDPVQERILVVDDDPAMRRTVERVLDPPYEVTAVSGIRGVLESLSSRPCDVALVDVQLGDDVDGYEVSRQIKQLSPDTDVILMTGSASHPEQKLYRALEQDAFYFLFKPFERRVLRALVERCMRVRRERKAKERFARTLAEDLERARRFQRELLPRRPLRFAGWHVEGFCRPCDALGGDHYFTLEDGADGIVAGLTDVVGHGVNAALFAGMLRSSMDAARRRAPDPEAMLLELRGGIDFLEAPRYASVFYLGAHRDGRLRYVNCGHPPAAWQSGDAPVRWLKATGPILMHDLPTAVHGRAVELRLSPGDRVLVYSDGVSEALSPDETQLEQEGLADLLLSARDLPAPAVLEHVVSGLVRHCGERPLGDDATLLLVARE